MCLQRMEEFHTANPRAKNDFEDHLLHLLSGEHPSRSYYIFKTIILNNLYGVDLMKEAVEIAKLRLFLKLVAEVDPSRRKKNFGLEPLPDIDFNIRSGNTLVGFATERQLEEVVKNVEGSLVYEEKLEVLKSACKNASASFAHFKKMQMVITGDSFVIRKAKQDYADAIKTLDEKLNRYLANTYGLELGGAKTQWKSQKEKEQAYREWKDSHQPFHWFAEFYEIISKGGFDVVIGNPPYVNLNKINYKVDNKHYSCYECKDLFALVVERSFILNKNDGRNGFIIPLSGLSTNIMLPLREMIFNSTSNTWNSYYSASDQPASLFMGVRHRLLITLNQIGTGQYFSFSTNFLKWFSSEREVLFEKSLFYCKLLPPIAHNSKLSYNSEWSILKKIINNTSIDSYIRENGIIMFYHNAPVHWHKIFDFAPYYSEGGTRKQSSHLKSLFFKDKKQCATIICALSSTLFYWYNWQYSNCRDLSTKDLLRFPFSLDIVNSETVDELLLLKNQLMKDLKQNSKIYKRVSKGILTEFDSFYPMHSKPIIDEIDKVLAKHYGFTEEELDFIINYDIKYRMGGELEGEG